MDRVAIADGERDACSSSTRVVKGSEAVCLPAEMSGSSEGASVSVQDAAWSAVVDRGPAFSGVSFAKKEPKPSEFRLGFERMKNPKIGGWGSVGEPLGVEELTGWFVEAFVGVCAEEVALSLQQVGGQAFCAVAVVVGERCAEGWDGDAVRDGGADGVAPVGLGLDDDVGEERVEEEVLETGIPFVRLFDAVEEVCADDATASPDCGDITEVELPPVLISGCAELDEALCVRDDF